MVEYQELVHQATKQETRESLCRQIPSQKDYQQPRRWIRPP